MTAFDFLEASEYLHELNKQLPRAKQRVIIATMVLFWDGKTEPLFTHLLKLLERGVTVHIGVDAFARFFMAANPPAPFGIRAARRRIARMLANLATLKQAGAEVHFIGSLGHNPYKHRFHQKFTIIDDTVYFGGGINFSSESFDVSDYMLKRTDTALAQTLIQQLLWLEEAPTIRNFTSTIDKHTTLLIDGGTPHTSLIYQRAVDIAREAREILYVSQMRPSGELYRILRKGHAECYFTRPLQTDPIGALGQLIDSAREPLKNRYRKKAYIHAKYIVFTMKNGNKKILSGSHNFSYRGVAYGTREIAVESSDIALIQHLESFTSTYIR